MNQGSLPLVRKSVSRQIVEHVLKGIGDGEYCPGHRLPSEPELLARWNVSPASLRDAFKELETLGLISRKPRVGTVIQQFNPETIFKQCASLLSYRPDLREDVEEMREVVEDALVTLVCKHGAQADWDAMSAAVDRMAEATTLEELLQADLDFHQSYYRATKNVIFAAMVPLLVEYFATEKLDAGKRFPLLRAQQVRKHANFLNALIDGDVARAQHYCNIARRPTKTFARTFAEATNRPARVRIQQSTRSTR